MSYYAHNYTFSHMKNNFEKSQQGWIIIEKSTKGELLKRKM